MSNRQVNQYKHPLLFKGTRIVIEGQNLTLGNKGKLCRCAVMLPWQSVNKLEAVGAPELIFEHHHIDGPLIALSYGDGLLVYASDPLDQVAEAWESWLNDASLRYKNVLTN